MDSNYLMDQENIFLFYQDVHYIEITKIYHIVIFFNIWLPWRWYHTSVMSRVLNNIYFTKIPFFLERLIFPDYIINYNSKGLFSFVVGDTIFYYIFHAFMSYVKDSL